MRTHPAWILILVAGQAGDLFTTWLDLHSGVPEGNPMVRAALASGDFALFGAVKVALVAAVILLALRSKSRSTRLVVQVLGIGFLGVSALNGAGIVAHLSG